MTIYCYDTEFLEDGRTIDLISIGIVCEDGREYYAVNADMDVERISESDWLCRNVVLHLPLIEKPWQSLGEWSFALDLDDVRVKPRQVIANEVREFLLSRRPTTLTDEARCAGDPKLWAYYGAYDHVALAQLFGPMVKLPNGIPMYTNELVQEMEALGVDSSIVRAPADAHDALADARWNMAVLTELRRIARDEL